MRRALITVLVLAGCCLTLTSCASGRRPIRGEEVTGLDRKLAPFAWIEQGDLVTFIVNTRPARYRDNTEYMPLQIAVANRGVKQKMSISRESFTLLDSEGNRYPCAAPTELREGYKFLEMDRSPALADLEGLVFDKFAAMTRFVSNFSPGNTFDVFDPASGALNVGSGLVIDRVALPRYGYIIDMIYFPKPRGGIKGKRFELFLDSPQLEDPVFVRFEVQ